MKKRWAVALISTIFLVGVLTEGNSRAGAQTAPTATPPGGVGVAVSGSGPTATPGSTNLLPSGTLILLQKNQSIALPPSGKPISLQPEQYGAQAAGNGKVGIRFAPVSPVPNSLINLLLVDNSTEQTKPIPQGSNLNSPTVTWKKDGSGVAFYDFVPPGKKALNIGAILYYDVTANTSRVLIPAPAQGQTATSVAWSPDGRYLLYLVNKVGAEGTGGPDSKPVLYDSTTGQSSALPPGANGFSQWDRSGTGFFAQAGDIAAGTSQIVYYQLAAITTPVVLTPANTLDFLVDLSPDGKRLVVTSSSDGKNAPIANLVTLNLNGTSRKAITNFKSTDQSITGLVWGTDGIYYSLSGSQDDTTWRIGLDGSNPQQVAVGRLVDIIGSR